MRTKFLSTLAVAAIFFASCNNDDNTPEMNDGRVQFSSGIETRVGGDDGDNWNSGDAIGIYMIEHGQTISDVTIREAAKNVQYTTSSNTNFANFYSTTPIYYPVNGPLVDFKAYYPYTPTIDDSYWYEIDLQNQQYQSAIDLITATANNNGEGYDKTYTGNVSLEFQHQFAKVIINVEAGEGVNSLSGLGVKVNGMHHTVLFDLTDFTIAGSGYTDGVEIIPYNRPDSYTYELIMIPTELYSLSDCKFAFKIADKTYHWVMNDNSTNITELDAGKKYTFNIRLQNIGVMATGTINPWEVVGQANGVAE